MNTRIPLWTLLVAILLAFGGGSTLGFHYGSTVQKYLQTRHDLATRVYYQENVNFPAMTKRNEMGILNDTLLVFDSPAWLGHLRHRNTPLAPEVIQKRKDTIAAILEKYSSPKMRDEDAKMSQEVVDNHLSQPDLYMP